jgi:hypothetical protein
MKIISARKRSPNATCQRYVYVDDEPRSWVRCGEPLVMFFTPSPISALPYETLLVLRCPEHIESGTGVLPESAESPWRS